MLSHGDHIKHIHVDSIVRLVNTSLRSGRFPDSFKEAVIRPILKKPNLNTDELKNYRPVCNLQFVSKIIEKTVMARLEEHIVDNNLHDPSQSAYKKCHSTETALLKINNDILASLDNKHCVILASLVLSAAFDTVDHTILLHRPQNDFGIEGKSLKWFTSFITGRTQRVCIDGNSSDLHQLIVESPKDLYLVHACTPCTLKCWQMLSENTTYNITATQTTHKCMYAVKTMKMHVPLQS